MNSEAVEHIKLYFEKKRYRINIQEIEFPESDVCLYWSLYSDLVRISFGYLFKKDIEADHLPIPYEKIYEFLSGESFPIFDTSSERYVVYSFPKLHPLEKFCLYVDLLPYD